MAAWWCCAKRPAPRPGRADSGPAAGQAQPAARCPLLSRDGDGAHDGNRRWLRGWRSRCAAPRSRAAPSPVSVRRRAVTTFRASRRSHGSRTSPTPARCTGSAPASSTSSATATRVCQRRSCSISMTPTTWCTGPTGAGAVQYARGWPLFPADPYFRGKLRQANPVVAPTRQTAFGGGDRARAPACHPPHPPSLAPG